ncbi:MAG: hypothetical protein WDO19_13730 [Bacteroidota bacterium]
MKYILNLKENILSLFTLIIASIFISLSLNSFSSNDGSEESTWEERF